MKGKISEIFDSIQGEGLYFGEKQLFVRFFGCNLNCKFCDTKLDYYREYETRELFQEIKTYQDSYHSVSFTGGEPLLQKDFLKEILKMTAGYGYKNYLETNGTLPLELEEVIADVDIIAMDLKLPTSTLLGKFWDKHRRFLDIAAKKEVFLKSVICQSTSEEDLRDALKLIRDSNLSLTLVLQPNSREDHGTLMEKLGKFKNICLGDGVSACVIPQMHKILGIK